jgi:hypothetical protein
MSNRIIVLIAGAIVLTGGIYFYKNHSLESGPTTRAVSARRQYKDRLMMTAT